MNREAVASNPGLRAGGSGPVRWSGSVGYVFLGAKGRGFEDEGYGDGEGSRPESTEREGGRAGARAGVAV